MAQKKHAQAQARSDSVQCIPDPHRTAPALPQADANGVLDDWRWGLDADGDIIVNVDQLDNSFTTEDVITVYFGDAPPQSWMIDPNTNPPDGQPYPFYFKAGELPDGQYNVFYTITETLSGGTVFCSPNTPVVIVNSPDRQGVVVDHIGTPTINPNNAAPGGTDGIQVTVYDANGQGIPNAWVAFYGPSEATIEPPVTQTDSDGLVTCNVTYPDQGTITVDVWCGRKFQDANPTYGQASLYLLRLSPVTNNVYADGTQQNAAEATLENSNGVVVTDPGQQQNVIFTLPSDKSATFPDGSRQTTVETVGGYATVSFTDSNEFGETVNLNAQLQSGLAKQPPALPFTFKAVWSLPLTSVTNNAPADNSTPDVAQVGPVTRDGATVADNTQIQFSLNSSSSAQFVGGGQTTVVGTSGGYAKASFVDSKIETVTISAALQQDQKVTSIPPSLPFQFATAHSYALSFTDPPPANNQPADGSAPDQAQVVVTDNGGPLSDPVVVTFDFLSGSATFVLTGDPNIQPGSTGQTLYVKTHFDSSSGKDIADASFTDTTAEGVELQGALKDFPNVNGTQDFTFQTPVPHWYFMHFYQIINGAPADGTTPNQGQVVVTDENKPVPDGTIVKFQMSMGSATFQLNDPNIADHGDGWIEVKTQTVNNQSIANAWFTDSTSAGETISITATLPDLPPSVNHPSSTAFFTFMAADTRYYALTLNALPDGDGATADGLTPDKAEAVVTFEGQPVPDGTIVQFSLPSGSTAKFKMDDHNIASSGDNFINVKTHTSNGQSVADASFTDTNAETVTLTAVLPAAPIVPGPTTKDFTFTTASNTIYLVTDIGTYVSLAPEYGTYDSGHIVACDKTQPDDLCKFTVSSHTGGQIAAQDGLNLDVASSTVSDDFNVPYLIATSGWSLQDGTSGFRINYEDGDSKVTLQNTGLQSLPYVSRTHTLQLGGINVLAADHASPDSTCYFKIIRVPS